MGESRLGQRLKTARQRRFVGRARELAVFQSAISAQELPFILLAIFGPGGIGKSLLLQEFARLSHEAGLRALRLDARNFAPSPESFLAALCEAMHVPETADPAQALGGYAQRQIILLDTYELLAPLDAWLRDIFLPQLPDDILIVIAGQNPLSPGWNADPGWQSLTRSLSLRNLSPDESADYLAKRSIPDEQHRDILAFTHGHPLALSLVADAFDQHPEAVFQPESEPDMIKVLLERLLQQAPGPAFRAALEVCALVRLTTESLLTEVLALPDAHEQFMWLRALSFVESSRLGLIPHELAREVLVADLHWRNPEWYAELHRRLRDYYAAHFRHTRDPQHQQQILLDYIHLHRDSPSLRPYLDAFFAQEGTLMVDVMRAGDVPLLLELIERHEGAEARHHAGHWFDRQPQGVTVLRDTAQQPVAFIAAIVLNQADPVEVAADPATHAAWAYLHHHAPLRPDEIATIFRFWMDNEEYQTFSYIQGQIAIRAIHYYLTTANLAFTFLPCADPAYWEMLFTYADLHRIPEADYQIDGRHYGEYGHDWRVTPPMAWLELMGERETSVAPQVAPPPPSAVVILVLSETEFGGALRDALRDLLRADRLRTNPLLRTRLVEAKAGHQAGAGERIAALQQLIITTTEQLQTTPREMKLYRVLYHTYLHPAATQEQAAELLDLPFSTYRRHLKAGVSRLATLLWEVELRGPAL